MRVWRDGRLLQSPDMDEFCFFGPTCDSIDAIRRPYLLPAGVRSGDYIEFGQLGAYGDTLRTNFNGFGVRDEVVMRDEPMLSMFVTGESAAGEARLGHTTPIR